MRRVALLLLLAACHSSPSPPPADAGPDKTASRPKIPVSAAVIGTSSEKAPTVAGSTIKATLSSGATLTMPANAVVRDMKGQSRLPEMVHATHLFNLGGPKRLLMVNETKLDGRTCDAALDAELERMSKAKSDTDSARTFYRQVGKVEDTKMSGVRVLYGDSMNRGISGRDAGRPAVAMATLIMCREQDFVVMMYTLDQPELPQGIKQMFGAIVSSYSPKTG
jgi:hypothetical protein